MAFFLHPHTPRLLPSYPYVRPSATGLVMKRIRLHDDEPSVGSSAAGVTLGALAGFVVGVVVAQRVGGLSGITSRLRDGFDSLVHRGRNGFESLAGAERDEEEDEEYDDEAYD